MTESLTDCFGFDAAFALVWSVNSQILAKTLRNDDCQVNFAEVGVAPTNRIPPLLTSGTHSRVSSAKQAFEKSRCGQAEAKKQIHAFRRGAGCGCDGDLCLSAAV